VEETKACDGKIREHHEAGLGYLLGAIIGLVVMLIRSQLYTWRQVVRLMVSNQALEAESVAGREALRREVESQRACLDEALREIATLAKENEVKVLRAPQANAEGKTAAAVQGPKPVTLSAKAVPDQHGNSPRAITPTPAPRVWASSASPSPRPMPVSSQELPTRAKAPVPARIEPVKGATRPYTDLVSVPSGVNDLNQI
jgi:hypothetical protein